jgi:mannosyltransferase
MPDGRSPGGRWWQPLTSDGGRPPTIVSVPLVLVIVCAVAAGLRLYHIGHKSYWLDEAVSLELAGWPWQAFKATIRSTEANMVLYYTLLRPWVRIGGEGETWARLLSCVFGVLTVPALYLVGRRLFSRPTAVVAAAMLALDTGAVWASQEARSYALLVLLTTTSWWLLLRAAEERPGRRAASAWGLYLGTGALAVYAHFYAVLVLAAQGIVLLFIKLPSWRAQAADSPVRKRVPLAVIVGCGVALIGALWPLGLFLARPHHNIDWIANGARGFHAALEAIKKPILHPTVTRARNELYVLAVTGPLVVLAVWGTASVRSTRWRWGLLLLWLGVPIICSVVVSVTLQPIIDPRYLTICLPPLCLLAAGALMQIWPRWPAYAALALLLVADIGSLDDYYRTTQNEDWRGVTEYVLARAQPGDYALFYASYVRTPFDLYRRLQHPASSATTNPTTPPTELRRWRPVTETTAEARARADRVWVLLSHLATPDCENAVDAYLRGRFTRDDSLDFNQIQIRLYADPAPTSRNDDPWLLARVGEACTY